MFLLHTCQRLSASINRQQAARVITDRISRRILPSVSFDHVFRIGLPSAFSGQGLPSTSTCKAQQCSTFRAPMVMRDMARSAFTSPSDWHDQLFSAIAICGPSRQASACYVESQIKLSTCYRHKQWVQDAQIDPVALHHHLAEMSKKSGDKRHGSSEVCCNEGRSYAVVLASRYAC